MTVYDKLREYSSDTGTHYWTNLYQAKAQWIRKNSGWGRELLKHRLHPDCTTNYFKKVVTLVWGLIRFSDLNITSHRAEIEAIDMFLKEQAYE